MTRTRRNRILAALDDQRGNVAIISVFVLVPLILALGFGVDYTLQTRARDQMNGLADSAVLAAVTPEMMTRTADVAQAAAQAVFTAGAPSVANVNFDPAQVTVTVADTPLGANLSRTVRLSWSGAYRTVFTGIVGQDSLPISGESSARSALAPSIDFYLLLDASPSMAVAATTAAIAQMEQQTSLQAKHDRNCAFACHEASPAVRAALRFPNDSTNNAANLDNYEKAEAAGIPLRIDLVRYAVETLLTQAPISAAVNATRYRVAITSFDLQTHPLSPLTSDFPAAATAAKGLAPLEVWSNNFLTQAAAGADKQNNDTDTYINGALTTLNSQMPKPGLGTKAPGDTPQEVVFLITDGVNDYDIGAGRTIEAIDDVGGTDSRAGTHSVCAAIKARNIRIAVLYLTYHPMANVTQGATAINDIPDILAPDAAACASPGLYFQVDTNGDVSSALLTMFQKVIATARLTAPAQTASP